MLEAIRAAPDTTAAGCPEVPKNPFVGPEVDAGPNAIVVEPPTKRGGADEAVVVVVVEVVVVVVVTEAVVVVVVAFM